MKYALSAFVLLVLSLTFAATAHAQAAHVYVTANRGTDLNPCSRTSPCRTIQHALDTTLVQQRGEVTILDSGDYDSITISSTASPPTVTSVTVDAAPGVITTINPLAITSTNAIYINSGASGKVVLRNLTLSGQGGASFGVYHNSGDLHIEDCNISGFSSEGIYFYGSGQLYVKDSTFRRNSQGVDTYGNGSGSRALSV
jgi:hypothetical protein